ncbi:hypothetical protein ACFL6G_01870 [candidate division KSB1 bacterium]
MSDKSNKNAGRKKTKYKGLCPYCKHSTECTFPRDPECPVYHCEEFDDDIPDDKKIAIITDKSTFEKNLYESPRPEIKGLGLCSNCEHRESCTFPKSEGGVWRCEEYE